MNTILYDLYLHLYRLNDRSSSAMTVLGFQSMRVQQQRERIKNSAKYEFIFG